MHDYTIIGGGIVGLSVAYNLLNNNPNLKVQVIEKEKEVASHQTGHNSGVIHSGIYYKPGSYKAKFAKAGSESMRAFCQEHDVDVDICGKVIVATDESELTNLENLYERGRTNGLDVELLDEKQLKEIEPHVNGIKAIRVPTAGIVSYKHVSEKLAELLRVSGGAIHLSEEVTSIVECNQSVTVRTNNKTYHSHYLINCAGLQSDRIAKMAGYHLDMKIVPFRGEYYKLKPEKRYLVNNLIYPVPNPEFPFLGVHFTRMIDGEVDAGPNAVLSFKREGYNKTDFNAKDLSEVLTYGGFWRIARKYMKTGIGEMVRSYNKDEFVKSLQRLIPEVQKEDLVKAPSGVRAQALTVEGKMVDDFHLVNGKRSLHVCNAPSPAATASLEIGKEIAKQVLIPKTS
ncbi:L-2-hydroxyglutarate oxidase [Geomicrobium sediminis]|uniref:L-2-hydroxyglutarate oxidase n=1 Tax=Geomicrobium sediminis TaxID=1347788 RepID=A0ABS2PGL9_9BACL|nr:L-2-hydroxyglutarate oxidase [Geomicrobium sediminis]MBM7634583.1 L-2-hydroxyglutarate oxidase [Geomicrobium sediminis]